MQKIATKVSSEKAFLLCLFDVKLFQAGTLALLVLFGYMANSERDYILTNAKSPDEATKRTETAQEFRRFYDELKKRKEDDVGVLEYYLSVSSEDKRLCFIVCINFSIRMVVIQQGIFLFMNET